MTLVAPTFFLTLGIQAEMTLAFVFPGQGSQTVGMGKALAQSFSRARTIFEEVDDALGQPLSRLMFEGPQAELTLTEHAQPALMAVSIASVRVLEGECGKRLSEISRFVAGHSLGEYSALAAVGTFALGDVARLLRIRGQAMQQAVPVGSGAMVAILGLELDAAETVVADAACGQVCEVANDNTPDQVVFSGDAAAIERACVLAIQRGARRCVPLPVSAPFHCSLMQPAGKIMAQELATTDMEAPAVPLIANVTATPIAEPGKLRELLVRQVTERVRWRESIMCLRREGIETIVECGVGKVLSGLVRRIDRDLRIVSLGTPEDIETFITGTYLE